METDDNFEQDLNSQLTINLEPRYQGPKINGKDVTSMDSSDDDEEESEDEHEALLSKIVDNINSIDNIVDSCQEKGTAGKERTEEQMTSKRKVADHTNNEQDSTSKKQKSDNADKETTPTNDNGNGSDKENTDNDKKNTETNDQTQDKRNPKQSTQGTSKEKADNQKSKIIYIFYLNFEFLFSFMVKYLL